MDNQVQRKTYNYKIVKLNNYYEEYDYTKPQVINKRKKRKLSTIDTLHKKNNIDYNIIRRQNIIRRALLQNEDINKFITLTFKNHITEEKEGHKKLEQFIKRFKYKYPKTKYIAIPEKTKKGRMHYHLLTNNEYIKNEEIAKIWQQGFIKINRFNNKQHIALYVTKYITKEQQLKVKKKHIYMSRNIEKPEIYVNYEALCEMHNKQLNMIMQKKYKNKHIGILTYTFYERTINNR